MQSSSSLLSVSVGIMAIIFITDLSPRVVLIIDVLLMIVIFLLSKTIISSQYQLIQREKPDEPRISLNSPHFFTMGVLLMTFIAFFLMIYSYLKENGGFII